MAAPSGTDVWSLLLAVRDEAAARRAGLAAALEAAGGGFPAPDLVELYLPLCLAGPHTTVAQLGQSLDGYIATASGDALFVTGEDDRTHLHRLRALVDAVVVGVGTVLADDPRLTVRAVPGPNPVRVVLDPRARAPRDARVFGDGAARTVWVVGGPVCGPDRAPVRAHVELLRLRPGADGRFAPGAVLAALAERGLGRVLVEGGGITVSRFLAARAIDRLYLTVAPFLLGGGRPGIRFPGPERLRDCWRPPVRRFALGPDTVYELDLTASGPPAGP